MVSHCKEKSANVGLLTSVIWLILYKKALHKSMDEKDGEFTINKDKEKVSQTEGGNWNRKSVYDIGMRSLLLLSRQFYKLILAWLYRRAFRMGGGALLPNRILPFGCSNMVRI